MACHQRGGVGRKLVLKLNAREQKFNRRKKIFDLPKIQWKIQYLFYVLLWQKISHCGINTFVPPMHTHEPEIRSMFCGYQLCSLDAFVGWLWYIDCSKGFLNVTVLTPFSRAYVEHTEKGEPLHLLCFKLERIRFFMWGWLEWKFNGRKRIYIFQRSIGRYRSHIWINTFSQQIHSWCGLKRILVIILLPLPVCSHHHRRHHTVAAQHSFLGETMASTNETMFDTPTKKNNGKSLSKVRKKRTTSKVVISPVFESSPSTALTV